MLSAPYSSNASLTPPLATIALIGQALPGRLNAADFAEAILRALAMRGRHAHMRWVRDGESVETEVEAAVHAGASVIAALGGDGIANVVANALRGTTASLAVVPFGAASRIAHRYGLPDRPSAIAEMLARGAPTDVNVGSVNGRLFLDHCSFGIYADLHDAQRRDRQLWRRLRPLAIAGALARTWRPHARLQVDIETLERAWTGRASMVFASPHAHVFDDAGLHEFAQDIGPHRLGVFALQTPGARRIVGLGRRDDDQALCRSHESAMFATSQARVHVRERHLPLRIDGLTVRLDAPIDIGLAPTPVRLIVPSNIALPIAPARSRQYA